MTNDRSSSSDHGIAKRRRKKKKKEKKERQHSFVVVVIITVDLGRSLEHLLVRVRHLVQHGLPEEAVKRGAVERQAVGTTGTRVDV